MSRFGNRWPLGDVECTGSLTVTADFATALDLRHRGKWKWSLGPLYPKGLCSGVGGEESRRSVLPEGLKRLGRAGQVRRNTARAAKVTNGAER